MINVGGGGGEFVIINMNEIRKKINEYRNFSEEMQEKDLKEVLEIIYPDTIFCGYKRMEREIKIFFKLHGKIRSCVLLADQVVDMPNRMELDNNLQYEYQKYMVARGYSELWINNHYVKERKNFLIM